VYEHFREVLQACPYSVQILTGIPDDVERVLKKYLNYGNVEAVKKLIKAMQQGDFFDVLDDFLDDFAPIEISVTVYLNSDELLDIAVDLLTFCWLNVDVESIDYHEGPSGAELYIKEFYERLEAEEKG
jgi:hypothetical protein